MRDNREKQVNAAAPTAILLSQREEWRH